MEIKDLEEKIRVFEAERNHYNTYQEGINKYILELEGMQMDNERTIVQQQDMVRMFSEQVEEMDYLKDELKKETERANKAS